MFPKKKKKKLIEKDPYLLKPFSFQPLIIMVCSTPEVLKVCFLQSGILKTVAQKHVDIYIYTHTHCADILWSYSHPQPDFHASKSCDTL